VAGSYREYKLAADEYIKAIEIHVGHHNSNRIFYLEVDTTKRRMFSMAAEKHIMSVVLRLLTAGKSSAFTVNPAKNSTSLVRFTHPSCRADWQLPVGCPRGDQLAGHLFDLLRGTSQ
jgi:hypothetical protein